jgi:hypothetical protein
MKLLTAQLSRLKTATVFMPVCQQHHIPEKKYDGNGSPKDRFISAEAAGIVQIV